MPTTAERLLKMGKGSREESGLGNRKQNEEEYEKAVGGPPEMPKANPPQQVDKIHPGAKYGDKPPEKRIDVDQYIKPLGSFEHGTDYVPKTGLALLHKGEKVIPAKDNMADESQFAMVPGRKAKTPKKEHVATHITHHKDGSHTAVHKHSHPEHHPDETHALSNMDALHAHLEDHVGQPNSGEAEAEAGNPEAYTGPAAPAPAAGAPPAGAQAPAAPAAPAA
jgi:hypothetical protein